MTKRALLCITQGARRKAPEGKRGNCPTISVICRKLSGSEVPANLPHGGFRLGVDGVPASPPRVPHPPCPARRWQCLLTEDELIAMVSPDAAAGSPPVAPRLPSVPPCPSFTNHFALSRGCATPPSPNPPHHFPFRGHGREGRWDGASAADPGGPPCQRRPRRWPRRRARRRRRSPPPRPPSPPLSRQPGRYHTIHEA